jgi:hypothetical protein
MNTELERIWKEMIMNLSRYYLSIFLEGLRRTTKAVRLAAVPTEIRTEDLPNTRLELYRYVNLFGVGHEEN